MVGHEIERRFPDVSVEYIDVVGEPERFPAEIETDIVEKGLFWPVSAVNGTIFFDGIITLPKVMEAIDAERSRMERAAGGTPLS